MATSPPRAAGLLADGSERRITDTGFGQCHVALFPASPQSPAPNPMPSAPSGSAELLDSTGYAADISFTDTAQRACLGRRASAAQGFKGGN